MNIQYASILISIILIYLFLYFNETRWKRIVGCAGIMIVSVALGVVEDSIPLFVLMMVNLIIALLKLVEDVGELLDVFKK